MKENKKENFGLTIDQRIINLIKNLSYEKKQLLLDMIIEWQQKEQRDDPRIPCLIAVDYSTPKKALNTLAFIFKQVRAVEVASDF